MRLRAVSLALLAAAAVLHGCSCDSVPKDALTTCDLSQVVQGAVKTDILFVVDDSGSMQPHQTNLSNNLATFINALQSSVVANDFQIGVTTTSVAGFTGTLSGEQGCFVGPILKSGSATLVADFQAQVNVGTGGSGKEQSLRAMKLALTTPSLAGCTNNTGFLRPGARLAVVILTDEDDNSETRTPVGTDVANTNNKSHNDAGDGVDYKATAEDPVADYVGFLRGSVGGEVRDVVVAVIAGMDAGTEAPTCGYSHTFGTNGWGCENPAYDATCTPGACGLLSETNPGTAPNLTMDAYCCCDAGGASYVSTCSAAYDKADRLVAFLDAFAVNKRVGGSICDASFASTLQHIADRIISPTVPLSGEPADYRMMIVRLKKAATGSVVPCTVGLAAGADAVYAPATSAKPATLTFELAVPGDGDVCKLDTGDQILIDVVCAG